MARFENLVAISRFLREQYVSCLNVNEQLEKFGAQKDLDKVNAIMSSPTYEENIKTRFTIKELSTRVKGVPYNSVRYALLGAFELDIRNGRQVAELQDHGIKVHYDWGVTRPRYSYDPSILAVANRAALPTIPTGYVTQSIDPVVEIAAARAIPTGANPQPPQVIVEQCPAPSDHEFVTKLTALIDENFRTKHPGYFKNKPDLKDALSGILKVAMIKLDETLTEELARMQQSPEN